MKYMTPELYNACQKVDEEPHDQWEENLRLYEERLKEIDGKLPESVKKFMKTCHLHDADFDPWASFPIGCPPKAEMVIRQQNWGDLKFLCVLRYRMAHPGYYAQVSGNYGSLIDQKIHDGPGFFRPKFDPENTFTLSGYVDHWLYDEFDYLGTAEGVAGKEDVFSHSILLSSGVELNIIFSEFSFLYCPLGEAVVEG